MENGNYEGADHNRKGQRFSAEQRNRMLLRQNRYRWRPVHPGCIHTVSEITDQILALGGGSGSMLGTGGMATKLHAAQIVTAAGTEMVIANGEHPDLLYRIMDGEVVGTRFLAKRKEV